MIRKPKDIKILVVGNPGSIHAARFILLLQEIGYNINVFHAEYLYKQDEHLKNTTIHVAFPYAKPINNNKLIGYNSFFDFLIKKFGRRIEWMLETLIGRYFYTKQTNRAFHLAKLIREIKPEIVFSLKMQNEGYTVAKAKKILSKKFRSKWVHFGWGTDLELFGKDPRYAEGHLPQIREALENCDFFLVDSQRDVDQALLFGLKGENLGFCLAHGGWDLDELSKIRQQYHDRKYIIIKGSQGGYIGKAFRILAAMQQMPELFRNYQIKIIYVSADLYPVVKYLKGIYDLDIEIVGWLPYREILKLYAQSYLAISATDVEGSPSFLLEAMAMGAFPVISDMSSIREWIIEGQNGLLFPVDNVEKLVQELKKALRDPKLINKGQKLNYQITKARIDREKIKQHVKDLIEGIIIQ